MVCKENGKEGEKKTSRGKKASSLLRHCLSSKWSHPRKGSTVDNAGLDLIRELLRSSSLPSPAALFRVLSPYAVHLLTYSKIGQRIWLNSAWTFTWSMFFAWAALKSVYFSDTSGVPMAPVGKSLLQREEVFSRSSWPQEVNLYHRFKLVSIFVISSFNSFPRLLFSVIYYFWIMLEFERGKKVCGYLSVVFIGFLTTVPYVNVINVVLHVEECRKRD